ncbi:MAG: hypothetical protein MJZ38_02435 [archaeon]|nr:hypothetical protein [archaeon]
MNGTLPYTLGISVKNDGKEVCKNLIVKGTILPTGVKHSFTLAAGQSRLGMTFLTNQDATEGCVAVADCEELGKMCFELPSGLDASVPVEAVVTVGLNRLLIVTLNCNGARIEKTLDL